MYSYLIIDPRSPVVPTRTLGVEVTDPRLAVACDLGNIDEQHTPMGGRAACEVALTYPLPPVGVTLATLRPDLDSITAMAVLSLRAAGVCLDDWLLAIVRDIAKADGYVTTAPWAPRPLPTEEHPWSDCGPVEDRRQLAPLNAICFDRNLHIARRVAAVAAWLLGGEDPSHDSIEVACRTCLFDSASRALDHVGPLEAELMAAVRDTLRSARERTEAARREIVASLYPRPRRRCPYPMDSAERLRATDRYDIPTVVRTTVREDCGIALVRSDLPGAIGIGYCLAPVVVAVNPTFTWPSGAFTKKATVAFFRSPGVETMRRLADRLSREEAAELSDRVDMTATSASYWPGPLTPIDGPSVAHLLRAGRTAEALRLIADRVEEAATLQGEGWGAYQGVDVTWFLATTARIKELVSGRGWGGNYASGILGSPQGFDTLLSAERIAEIVREAV